MLRVYAATEHLYIYSLNAQLRNAAAGKNVHRHTRLEWGKSKATGNFDTPDKLVDAYVTIGVKCVIRGWQGINCVNQKKS